MSAPLGIGKAFADVVSGERERKAFYGAAEAAAQRFESIGTDNAKKMAQMMRSDPRGMFTAASQFGGMKELFTLEEANAGRQRVATATAGQAPGSREHISSLGGALIAEGEYGSGVNAMVAGLPSRDQKPIIREFKEGDRLVTKQWDGSQWVEMTDDAPRWAPQQNEEITVGPDGVTIRRGGTWKQEADEAAKVASTAGLLDDIDRLRELTLTSPGTVGDPATLGELGGRIGHTANQTFKIGDENLAEDLTQRASGGATQAEIAEVNTLEQSIKIGLRPILADKGNLNKDEGKDLSQATGRDAFTPENRVASLEAVDRLSIAHEIRRLRGMGRPSPLDPMNPANDERFINYLRSRGYTDEWIEKMDDRLSQ